MTAFWRSTTWQKWTRPTTSTAQWAECQSAYQRTRPRWRSLFWNSWPGWKVSCQERASLAGKYNCAPAFILVCALWFEFCGTLFQKACGFSEPIWFAFLSLVNSNLTGTDSTTGAQVWKTCSFSLVVFALVWMRIKQHNPTWRLL